MAGGVPRYAYLLVIVARLLLLLDQRVQLLTARQIFGGLLSKLDFFVLVLKLDKIKVGRYVRYRTGSARKVGR